MNNLPFVIFAVLLVAFLLVAINYFMPDLFGSPLMIWLDAPGTMSPGTPDRIIYPSYVHRTYLLDPGDDIKIYGSFYAVGNTEMCTRIGGVMKDDGRCLLTNALGNLDYIIDNQGNTYTSFTIYGADLVINQNYGYIPTSMTWYMKTSVPVIPPPPPTETCYDNIQNQDETGIDCGGVCPACYEPPPPDEFPWLPIILAIAVIVLIAAAVKYL